MYTSFQKFVVGKIYKKRIEHKHKSIMSINTFKPFNATVTE